MPEQQQMPVCLIGYFKNAAKDGYVKDSVEKCLSVSTNLGI